jgi:hypothetical protein
MLTQADSEWPPFSRRLHVSRTDLDLTSRIHETATVSLYNYSTQRSEMAKALGLGQGGRGKAPTAPPAKKGKKTAG